MPLFIFDFDNTIPHGHTHNIIAEQITREFQLSKLSQTAKDPEKQWEAVKAIKPIGSAEQWKSCFMQLAEAGHDIAIVSFNKHGEHIIPRYLREIIGLDEQLINHIFIISEFPTSEQDRANKNKQVEKVIQHYSYSQEDYWKIILIDDTYDNCIAANKMGCSSIEASEDGNHLPLIKQALLLLENHIKPFFLDRPVSKEFHERATAELFFIKMLPANINDFPQKNCYVITADKELYFFDEDGTCNQYFPSQEQMKAFIEKYKLDVLTQHQDPANPVWLLNRLGSEALDEFNKVLLSSQDDSFSPSPKW